MRIAMVAPLAESVPPLKYGGTERVVSVLTEELVSRGHKVTLFASADSRTSANLVSCSSGALRATGDDLLPGAAALSELADVYANAAAFDLIHSHVDWLAFPFARLSTTPTISTIHGRLDLRAIRQTYCRFPEQALVPISHSQRSYLPEANWSPTVYNGIALERFRLREEPGDYLVFLGRMSPEKGPAKAIEIAKRVGRRLLMAAKVDPVDEGYYRDQVAPLIRRSPWVDYIGEVDEVQKDALLGNAYAYLFPIDWPEPFGLTMVESMATGTPVIAHNRGSVPEVVKDGVTGFICHDTEDMVRAVENVAQINRSDCRAHVERLFCATAMTDGYEAIYRWLLSARRLPLRSQTQEIEVLTGS